MDNNQDKQQTPPSETPQPTPTPPAPSVPLASSQPTTEPINGDLRVGMSASQLGYDQRPKKSRNINLKQLALKGVILLVIVAGIFGILVATNVIALKEFKKISYTNTTGAVFSLDFYTKHSVRTQDTGNPQLVANVGKYEKLPLTFSITTGKGEDSYNKYKNCGSFAKVFEVRNSSLDQTIAVCDVTSKTTKAPDNGVYLAVFLHDGKSQVITIGQDYSKTDISSKSSAQASLTTFGLQPYQADISRIVASITAQQ